MGRLNVEVVHALPGRHEAVRIALDEGATVADAVRASGLGVRFDALAIFGRRVGLATPLREGDRVELLRALREDPREARRRRVARRRDRR